MSRGDAGNSYLQFVVADDVMPTRELLPGVTADSCPPRVICDAHSAIRKARRRRLVRDAIQIALLLSVDYLFFYWPDSRMPFLDRDTSLAFLRGVNLLAVADLWLTRALPKWWAKRIAGTWSRAEREKFKI